MARALIITPEIQATIDTVMRYAFTHPIELEEMKRRAALPPVEQFETAPGHDPQRQVDVPVGFRCIFTIEDQPPGRCRHLSVSVDDPSRIPNRFALDMLAQAFGFDSTPERTTIWTETVPPEGVAINMLQPIYQVRDNGTSIHCYSCGSTSHNANDVAHRYCGKCHRYHDRDLP